MPYKTKASNAQDLAGPPAEGSGPVHQLRGTGHGKGAHCQKHRDKHNARRRKG